MRSAVEESRFFQEPLKLGQGARGSIKRRPEGFPLCGIKTKRPPDGKGFIRPRQSAFQHELAHRTVCHRRSCLQGALRMARQAQVQFLRTCGVRWHDLRVAFLPDNVKTMHK
jgi:hypothetical protein